MALAGPAIAHELSPVVLGDRGPWLTLVHGGLASSATWGRVAADLAEQMRVLTYDLRGYRASDVPSPGTRVADHADDLLSLWAALGVERSHVAGFSFGGMVAQELAIEAPERVSAAVLLSTAAALDEPAREAFRRRAAAIEAGDGRRELESHVERAFSDHFRRTQPEALDEYRRQVLSHDPLAAARTFEAVAGFDRRGDLARVRCPVLVVAGDEDRGMGPEAARAIAHGIADCELVILPGRGHTLHIESPATVSHLIGDFATRNP